MVDAEAVEYVDEASSQVLVKFVEDMLILDWNSRDRNIAR